MKKNNGFIATSLLYSFFLVFIAILLSLVGNFLHNRVVLNSVINSVKNELGESGVKTVSSAEVGSYITIPLFSTGVEIATENFKWLVVSQNSNKTVTLVSDQVVVTSGSHQTLPPLQTELNRYHNLYTTGSAAINYMSYLTKTNIMNFEAIENLQTRKALLNAGAEYFYYDPSTSKFYLYQYTCNTADVCTVAKNVQIPTNTKTYYGLRFVMNISSNTPIASGIGVINDPYNVLYYVHQKNNINVLKLHYDNINHNGNLGFKASASDIVDLSGNNPFGLIDAGTYSNNLLNGATIPASRTINTNLNIQQIVSNIKGYTIEFRVQNNFRLSASPTYLDNFIMLTNNTTLKLYSTNYSTGLTSGSFNTFTIVKRPGETYLKVYINGQLINSNITVANLPVAANNILNLGGSTTASIFKSVRVYNTALTDNDILHNYSVDSRWSI